MTYQLVIQLPCISLKDYDALIDLEEILLERLSDPNEVDGHDSGAGEMNIFIRTNDPESLFKEIEEILREGVFWPHIRVAYRDTLKNDFVIKWPKELASFKIA